MLFILLILMAGYGLWKRKLQVSKSKELTGKPVIFLSLFYIIMLFLPALIFRNHNTSWGLVMGDEIVQSIVTIAAVGLVTPIVIFFFAKNKKA